MSEAASFPRRLILAGAMTTGVLVALAVHIIAERFGLDLGTLWRSDTGDLIPASAALAWWLVALAAFVGGYVTASLMGRAASGHIPLRLRQFLIAVGVLLLAAAGQAASAPSAAPTSAGVVAGLAALVQGAVMAFCGAYFALRRI
ncbi:hypothetical protein JQ557_17110 [Bradyrhizobium sp. U87765 SZCCT0131]|uniref:hypothetical protein n=1 Tax=unclassified Bradyrhizobium TaxID=2631580 RepID=UPI001BA4DF63|nr:MULTISPECIES: hypothetical protein [unclassified Bradyrhizobium]MBR1219730.1 hypothetical protein [Bradyrhizobium sp. U87765 SZCCT0131]MBR1262381.1 hypothetical protein [Bradyrhizobium sp. U87765 SZCCT0134]MBR1308436.1 hypothetical protein [Bradyrhizobium sp. U87765 SZCCT0110]MBR1318163.1 hypothetical protein [Bradyrhizobium sp. U87765 SZCCT0109]MBR1351866.1 hypothetical protein [Bradyrhizobium sp. U87765 SZCCT0048]